MTRRYLLSIAIGPVQDFIASARRSRDLWFGSWLLSELSKAAANKIADGDINRLIFPAISDLAQLAPADRRLGSRGYFSVVNKITARVDTDDLPKFAEGILDAMRERLRSLRSKAFKHVEKSRHFDQQRAESQIDDLIEFYWAAVPLPQDEHYPAARRRVEALLTASKNTRDFKDARAWAQEGVPKSSLDGLRESVIRKSAYDLSDEKRRSIFETRAGERLCGVGLLKRLGNSEQEEGFFSTSHLAALPLLGNLTGEHRDAVARYFESLKDIDKTAWSRVSGNESSETHKRIASVFQNNNKPCDGRLLFEDRLEEYFTKGDFSDKDHRRRIEAARSALREFLKEAFGENQHVRAPFPYYALLLADGDGMGDTINKLGDPREHYELSEKLSKFAESVRKIVETDHDGSLIYAGGDDVMAFVPLHQIVNCAKSLAGNFKETVESGPTLSIGIAVCHHLDPLSDALSLAREAEKAAKRLPGKNALCIKLDRRSGETTTVVDHWGKLDERLRFFTLLFVADKLPDGVAYEFHKLAPQLRYVEFKGIQGEVGRILKRKHSGHGTEGLEKSVAERLLRDLDELRISNPKHCSLTRLAEELIVARALAAALEKSYASQDAAKGAAQEELTKLLDESNIKNGG